MPNIRHQLLIEAPAQKVYSAITTTEGLSAWWTPGAKAEPRRDSIAHFRFGPDYFKEMKITDLKPSGQVQWLCTAGAAEWVGTIISFELQPVDKETILNTHPEMGGQQQQMKADKGTLVIFSHDDWKEYSPMFAECSYTWGQFLNSLKLFCETGKGRPWPDQHRTA